MQHKYWLEKDSNLKTAIENDLGITGLDAEELFKSFSKEFNTDMSDLDFDKYFAYEGKEMDSFKGILVAPVAISGLLLLFIFFLIQCVVGLIILFFDKQKAKKIFGFSLTGTWGLYSRRRWPNKHPENTFNLGDLVASAVAGRFVKREKIHFKLI